MCVPSLHDYRCVIYRYQCCEICKHCNSVILSTISYYRANTFLSCRISKLKMTEFGATVVKNQQFRLLWHPFPHLRLKLGCFESNLSITRLLIPLFYVESANQNPLQSIQPPLLHVLQYSILQLKKILTGRCFYFFFIFAHPCTSVFFKNEADSL